MSTGPANPNYSGALPSGFNNHLRYQDQVQYEQVAQYQDSVTQQQRQRAAMSNPSPHSYGSGTGDELSNRLYQRQAYMARSGSVSGVVNGVTNLGAWQVGSAVTTAAGVGGLSVAGLAIPALAAAAITPAFTRDIKKNMDTRKESQQIAADFDVYRNNLGFSRALSFQESTAAGYSMRSQMHSGSNNFFGADQQQRIHKLGQSNGMLNALGGNASGTLSQYKENFKELVDTTEEVVKTLKTTIEGGMSVMKELKQNGMNMSEMKSQVKNMSSIAGGTGTSVQNVMAMSRAGAVAAQGTPWSARTGSSMYVENMNRASNMANTTGDAAASVAGVGGIANAGAILANAQMSMFSSGMGTKMASYMMNQDGSLNKGRMNSLISGDTSTYEMVDGANRNGYNMGASGRVMFERNKNKMFDSMSSSDRNRLNDVMFDRWSEGRGGTKDARAMVFARQFGSNAREVELHYQNNMRVRGTDYAAVDRGVQRIESAGQFSVGSDSRWHGRVKDVANDFLTMTGAPDIGMSVFNALDSKEAHSMYGRLKRAGKWGLGGAAAGAAVGGVLGLASGGVLAAPGAAGGALLGGVYGAAAGFATYTEGGNNGGMWGSVLRKTGAVSRFSTFEESGLVNSVNAGNANLGIGMSQNAAAGMDDLRMFEAAGGVLRTRRAGNADNATLATSWDDANGTYKGAMRNFYLRAKTTGATGFKEMLKDDNFLAMSNIEAGGAEHKRLMGLSDTEGTKIVNDNIAFMNTKTTPNSAINAANRRAESAASGLSWADSQNAKDNVANFNTSYDSIMTNESKRLELGVPITATRDEVNDAAKKFNSTRRVGRDARYETYNGEYESALVNQHAVLSNKQSEFSIQNLSYGVEEAQASRREMLNGAFASYNKSDNSSAGTFSRSLMMSSGTMGFAVGASGHLDNKSMQTKLKGMGFDTETAAGMDGLAGAMADTSSEVYKMLSTDLSNEDFASFSSGLKSGTRDINIASAGQARNRAMNAFVSTSVNSALSGRYDSSEVSRYKNDLMKIYSGGSEGQLQQFLIDNKEIVQNGIGIGTGVANYSNWAANMTKNDYASMVTKTQAGSQALQTTAEAQGTIALRAARDAVTDFTEKTAKEEYLESNGKDSYDTELLRRTSAEVEAKNKLEAMQQEPTAGGVRQAVVNPPVISYWDNQWAIR